MKPTLIAGVPSACAHRRRISDSIVREEFSARGRRRLRAPFRALSARSLPQYQFTAETFLISTAPFVYWALLKAMRRDKSEWWIWAVVALLFGTTLLLFKQSGFLLLAISVLLPFARLRTNESANASSPPGRYQWRATALNLVLVIAVVVGSRLAADALLPSAFNATRDHFNSRWVMPASELIRIPAAIWRVNLANVADYISAYYTWIVAVFFCWVTWFAFRRKNFPELTLAGMCLAGAGGVTFLLRGFNEYLFNTALIAVLLPLLGRMAVSLYSSAAPGENANLLGERSGAGRAALVHWIYQDTLIVRPPGDTSSGALPGRSAIISPVVADLG